jgi:diacylglycerol kinase family enzyme
MDPEPTPNPNPSPSAAAAGRSGGPGRSDRSGRSGRSDRSGRSGRSGRSDRGRRTWARLAAVAALLLLGFAVLPFLVLAVNVPDLLLAVGCLAAAVYCVWLLVTRHSIVRLLAVPGVALALAGLVAIGWDHRVELTLWIVTLALFGLAARAAVHGGRSGVAPHPVPPARHGVLVVNPRSGNGKAARVGLAGEAARRGVRTVTLRPGDDLRDLVERMIDAGADVVGMAGGDGSQAVVAAVASERDVAHVCVPAGTRNHFALDLGLDRDDPVGALDAFTDGVERRVDLAAVNGRIFVNNVSLGLYAGVVQSDAYRGAKLGTWRRLLPELLREPGDLRFDGPDGPGQQGATLVLVSNNPYELRRLRVAGSRPRLDSGTLGILSARLQDADGFARFATLSAVGQEWRMRGVRQWSAPGFEVQASEPVPVGLDGEAVRMAPPLQFVSRPGALRVRLPARARGVSPAGAAVSLSRRDLRRLIRIAAGR